MTPAQIRQGNGVYADLHGMSFKDADLSFSKLTGANLIGADLRGTSLHGACLDGTMLLGALRRHHDHPILGWQVEGGVLVRAGKR